MLYEECLYDGYGQLLNGSMADYLVPMPGEMPDIVIAQVQTPATSSRLGAKGAGAAQKGLRPERVEHLREPGASPRQLLRLYRFLAFNIAGAVSVFDRPVAGLRGIRMERQAFECVA